MLTLPRRKFLIGAGLALAGASRAHAVESAAAAASERTVQFRSDGLALSPLDHANLLARLAQEPGIEADDYSRGGVVAKLEQKMAMLLGKEMAVFFPTGTMANHLALRLLARNGRRVLVQHDSHVYNAAG